MSEQLETTDVALVSEESALVVLQDPEKFDAFYERVKAETDKLVPDLTTIKGRKEIASMARRVVKTKTFIDAERKKLTEDARAVINKADAAGKLIRDRLDILRDEVRKPLTDWEAAEDAREKAVTDTLARLRNESLVLASETADDILARIDVLQAATLDPAVFLDGLLIAESLKSQALDVLRDCYARAVQSEKDARDLAELRERERIRLEQEEAARIVAEAARAETERAENERLEIERREQEDRDRQIQAERDEADRVANAAAEAAEAARIETERKAQAEQDAATAAHNAEVHRLQNEAAEQNRLRQEADAREEKRLADEKAERDAADLRAKDREHKSKVMGAAKDALIAIMAPNFDDGTDISPIAISIVRAIVADEIPAVSLAF